jgi:hypothetical protein
MRFISEDPIGWASGQTNDYAYVGGNPVQFSDVYGLQAVLPPPALPLPGMPQNILQQNVSDGLSRAMSGGGGDDGNKKTYQTYTRYNPKTGGCYSGRTSGYGSPQENIIARAAGQPLLNAEGFLPPILDRTTDSYASVRGREQLMIDLNGGAKSSGGTSRNVINGISPMNPLRSIYIGNAIADFGVPARGPQCTSP